METSENRKRGHKKEGYKNNDPRYIEYYEKNFPDKTHEEHLEMKKKYTREYNYQCIEFYQRLNPTLSLEECEVLRRNAIRERKSNHPNNLEYYEKNFPDKTHEEHLEMLHKFSTENNYQCIEYYKKNFPDKTHEEHLEMLKQHQSVAKKKRPDNSGENNPSHHSKTTEQQRRERSILCIEYWRKKRPELNEQELQILKNNKIRELESKANIKPKANQLQYWLDRGYSEEEAKQKLKNRQSTFSLKKCIEKYGEEEGLEVFKNRQIKWQKSLRENFIKNGDGRSIQSQFAREIIGEICLRLNIELPKREKYMTDDDGSHYAYDFCYRNKIIEFNGDFWHCNPEIYPSDFINRVKRMSAQEIWKYDNKKINCAIRHNYKVLVIWEYDYNYNYYETINKCIEFLNDK